MCLKLYQIQAFTKSSDPCESILQTCTPLLQNLFHIDIEHTFLAIQ